MKKIFLMLVFFIPFYLCSQVKLEMKGKDFLVENEKIILTISPERGGVITSFKYKEWNNDIIPKGEKYVGLFMDHMWGQTWPGELLEVPYDVVDVKKEKERVEIILRREIKGIWNGVEQEIFKGLIIEKKYLIKAGSEVIRCNIKIKNPTEKGKLPAYWLQNVFFIGGDYDGEKDIFYRPSCRGIRKSFRDGGEKDFLKDPFSGWSAAIDTEKKEGILFLMDYNYLDMLYNCRGNLTLEWMYDKVPVPSGKEWETEVLAIPFTGFEKIVHASENFICDMKIKRNGNNLEITHEIKGDAQNVKISTEILGVMEKGKEVLPVLSAGNIGKDVKEIVQKTQISYIDPLVIFVKLNGEKNGKAIEEKYFDFYTGSYGYGDNIQQDMITPLLKVEKPPKKRKLMKPEKIARIYDDSIDIFIMKGLNSDVYKLEKAIERIKKERKFKVNVEYGYYSISLEGPRVTEFPFDYEQLMKQDLIVIANVNISCLGDLGIEMLKDYIENGGNILFLGGKSSYGNGGIKNSIIEEIVPFGVNSNKFDIIKTKNGYLVFNPHSIFNGIDIKKRIFVPYIHNIKVKKGKILIKTADGRCFLLVDKMENGGKIGCIFGAPYGEGKRVFYNWDEWDKLMSNLILYLVEKNEGEI